jgi:hypothetical protein
MSSDVGVRATVDKLGRALVERDFAMASSLTASWLRSQLDWERIIETELEAMAEEWELAQPPWPSEIEIGTNPLTYEGWVQTNESAASYGMKRDLPREINASNFKKRMKLTLGPAEGAFDFDEWCSFWLAIVEENGELRVGDVEVHR